jgi:sugar lactone lactonase YvrE
MRVHAEGLGLVESPRWHDGQLWFSDWTAGEIRTLTADGSRVRVRHHSLPLCFDFLPDDSLIVVSSSRLALLRVDDLATPGPDLVEYRDLSALCGLGWNDIVIDGRGNAYVNTPNFDMATGPPEGSTAPGLVALVPGGGGSAQVVADDIAFPNGMAVTADGEQLIVADSYRHQLLAFPIRTDGSLGPRRVFADLGAAAPDGICIDADGAVWYADVPHQECVRVADGGAVLDRIALDRGGFACILGDDGPTLYVVAARWPGMAALQGPVDWQGQVLSYPAPAGPAGWPG